MKFSKRLEAIGLAPEFIERATRGDLNGSMLEWLRKCPELEGIHIPIELKETRKALGCGAKRGGARPQRGKLLYRVWRGGRPKNA